MSQLETNPLVNPTVTVSRPTQEMEVKQSSIADTADLIPITRSLQQFSIPQLDYTSLAQKDKYVGNFAWTLSSTGNFFNIPIDVTFLRNLLQVSNKYNTFAATDNILISIKPTSNAFFQGYVNIAWDPSPTDTYHSTVNGIAIDYVQSFQFKCWPLTPKTTNEINIAIPLNFPFNYILLNPGNVGGAFDSYIAGYKFGTLRFYVVSPLATTSALTQLTYSYSASLIDLKTAGTYFYG